MKITVTDNVVCMDTNGMSRNKVCLRIDQIFELTKFIRNVLYKTDALLKDIEFDINKGKHTSTFTIPISDQITEYLFYINYDHNIANRQVYSISMRCIALKTLNDIYIAFSTDRKEFEDILIKLDDIAMRYKKGEE